MSKYDMGMVALYLGAFGVDEIFIRPMKNKLQIYILLIIVGLFLINK